MNLWRYPRTNKFLEETGMTLQQALIWTEKELEKREGKVKRNFLAGSKVKQK